MNQGLTFFCPIPLATNLPDDRAADSLAFIPLSVPGKEERYFYMTLISWLFGWNVKWNRGQKKTRIFTLHSSPRLLSEM